MVIKSKRNKAKLVGLCLVSVLVVFVVLIGAYLWTNKKADDLVAVDSTSLVQPASYATNLALQQVIKQKKPAPTEAALYYAYVSSVYHDVLASSNSSQAIIAAQNMSSIIFPDKKEDIVTLYKTIGKDYAADVALPLTTESKLVLDKYTTRFANDGHDKVWSGTVPVGPEFWVRKKPVGPLTPLAGEWQRWVVKDVIDVPAPPKHGSEEDKRQLAQVVDASSKRTGEDVNVINFWGGTPGTVTPSGIWLNQLYKTIRQELPKDTKQADSIYSELQMQLSQTISDSFMECWKVKYTYWTARPDMVEQNIVTAMDNPPFPSYVSGHSTISKAAADVLSTLVPAHQAEWQSMAVAARDSRLNAGIHFPVDNENGFALGAHVAEQAIKYHELQKVL